MADFDEQMISYIIGWLNTSNDSLASIITKFFQEHTGDFDTVDDAAQKALSLAGAIESELATTRNLLMTSLNSVESALERADVGFRHLRAGGKTYKMPGETSAGDPLLAPPCTGTAKIGNKNVSGIFGSSTGGGWRMHQDEAGNVHRVRTRGPVKCTAGAAEPKVDMGGYSRGPVPKDARKTTASYVGNGPPPCQGSGMVGGKKLTGIFGERKGGGWRQFRKDMGTDPVNIQAKGPVRCEAKLPDDTF